MTDAITKEPLRIRVGAGGWHSLGLPLSQVPQVQALLDAHPVRYWVNEGSITFDDDPPLTRISFYPHTDPEFVQRLLDSVP